MDSKRNNTTEEVLNSLDGIQKATMPDFFYTRLKARMEKGYESAVPAKSWIFRPAYAVAALMLVLIINAAVIFKNRETKANSNPEIESLQSIAAEYNLNETITEEVYK